MGKSLLSSVAKASKELSNASTPSMKESQIALYGRDSVAPIDAFEFDPLNSELRGGVFEVDALVESIKEKGFFGRVVAYKKSDNEKVFVVLSGERRVRAAKIAGIKEIPFTLVDAPKDEISRRNQLAQYNLLDDNKSPTVIANFVNFVYETKEKEQAIRKQKAKEAKANGVELPENERPYTSIIEEIAKEMGISTSSVDRYRKVNRLVPELQALCNKEGYNWSVISDACVLTPSQQLQLADRIMGTVRGMAEGTPPDGKWIREQINTMKKYMRDQSYIDYKEGKKPSIHETQPTYKYNRNDTSLYSEELVEKLASDVASKKRNRKKDGTKALANALKYLKDAFDTESSVFFDRDKEKKEDYIAAIKEIIEIAEKENK